MYIENLNKSVEREIKGYIIDCLNDRDFIGTYTSDLHNELFNVDYYIIYHSEAINWLKSHNIDAFEAIDIVFEYEKDNFGEVNTKINPESIVNMLVYILGEEILSWSSCLPNSERLSKKDIKAIIKALKE